MLLGGRPRNSRVSLCSEEAVMRDMAYHKVMGSVFLTKMGLPPSPKPERMLMSASSGSRLTRRSSCSTSWLASTSLSTTVAVISFVREASHTRLSRPNLAPRGELS